MPVLSVQNTRVLEQNSGSEYLDIRVSLDAAATAPVSFSYYTQGVTAEPGVDYRPIVSTATIPSGESFIDIRILIDGDTQIEGDESFEFVILPSTNAELPQGAAAMVATITIADNDDGSPDAPDGTTGPGRLIFGPVPEPGPLPTLTAHDVSVIEGDSGSDYAYFLVTLDRPATAPVTASYYIQEGSASASEDYRPIVNTVTIAAGQQSTWIRLLIDGDTTFEDNEDFQLVLTNINNGVFAGGGEALTATATILDDDGGPLSDPGGLGDPGTPIEGPDRFDTLPTVRFYDVTMIEGNSGSKYVYVPYTLDAPASTQLSVDYYTQAGTASDTQNDYREIVGTLTIPVGTESGYVRILVDGDTDIEGDESFSLILTNIQNGNFEDGAAVVAAEITILDNDSGPLSGSAGIGDPAQALPAPVSTATDVPVLQVSEVSVDEGDSGSSYVYFLITLDRPAPTQITGQFVFDDGTASKNQSDYRDFSGNFSIDAGTQSTYLRVLVDGDNQIEGNEDFKLVLTGLQNATFLGNGPALVANATIIGDDGGVPTLEPGIGDVAQPVLGPQVSDLGVVLDAVSTSIYEGANSSDYAYVYVLLSEPATTDVTVDWSTVQNADAISGTDFRATSGTLTIAAGASSGWVRVLVNGDTSIEGDESFGIEFSSPSGAILANGQESLTATVRIIGDDGAGTQATGPEFTFGTPANGDANYLLGTTGADGIRGFGGNDTIVGLAGNDNLVGDGGNDSLLGGAGNDTLTGNAGNDRLSGGVGSDLFVLTAGMGNDTVSDFQHGIDRLDFNALTNSQQSAVTFTKSNGNLVVRLGDGSTMALGNAPVINGTGGNNGLVGTAQDDFMQGFAGNDTISGGDGNDILLGQFGSDSLNGGDGNDTLNGGDGNDTLIGGDGDDLHRTGSGDNLVQAGSGDDYVFASEGNDEAYGGTGNDELLGGAGNDTLGGANGNDLLVGANGADQLWGGNDNDTAYGGDGEDTLGGGNGNDELGGGNDNDTIWAGGGNDTAFGGLGDDELSAGTGSDVAYGAAGNDTIFGANGNDTLSGGAGNDELWLGRGNDVAYGSTGNDTLQGGADDDELWGGAGVDLLNGGGGDDTLRGGGDGDTFVFSAGTDEVLDFGAGDKIDLSGVAAITNFADLQTNHLSGGANAVIDDGLGNTLTLAGVAEGTLQEGDFIF